MLTAKVLRIPANWHSQRSQSLADDRPAVLAFSEVERTIRRLGAVPLAGAAIELLSTMHASDGTEVLLECVVHPGGDDAELRALATPLEAINPASLGARHDATVRFDFTQR